MNKHRSTMKNAAPKGNNQKNEKENGYRKTLTERKGKCAINPSTVRDIETNGVKGVDKAVRSRNRSTGLKVMNKGVERTSENGTTAKNTCQKSGRVTRRPKRATKHNPTPKTASAIGGRSVQDPNRNKRNDTESEEEESVSTKGSSEEVTEEEISDEEEERDRKKESSEGDDSEEGAESSGVQRNTEETVINSSDKCSFGESKCNRSSEPNTVASGIQEETKVDTSSAGLKDDCQAKEIIQEDTSEKSTGCRTRRGCGQPSCTTKPAKESKHKMFKRSKADKQAEKNEKRRVKAEKQRLEKEAKQKAKEEKKNKKKPLKAEKHTSVTKEIQSTSWSGGTFRNKNGKNKSAKPTKNPEEDAGGKANMSELSTEENNKDEPALTKAIKGQNRFMHLKEKGKDLKNVIATPEEEISEGVQESGKVKQNLIAQRKGATTLNSVSGWIPKNLPQKFNLRKKLSAWTKAMGVSRWLSYKVIKHNPSPKQSKRGIVKHRMALRVASKTSLVSKNKKAKEKAGEGGGAEVQSGEKDTEAKYAVVLPRMNELGKTVETSQATPSPSAPSNMAEAPVESSSIESRPPKPGARLVLPVKPDLSLLKSIKKSLPGDISPGTGLSQSTPNSTQKPEGSLKMGESNRKAALENYNGVGFLQAARGKLEPFQINRTMLSLSGGTVGPTRARGQEAERDAPAGMPRSHAQPFPNGDAGSEVSGSGSICDEETDREVAQLMCEEGKYGVKQREGYWAWNPQLSGDPQVRSVTFFIRNTFLVRDISVTSTICLCLIKDWLRAENLLPHQTVEKLSNWAVYDDVGNAENDPAYNGRGPWVSEDPTQEMLESRLSSTQVVYTNKSLISCLLSQARHMTIAHKRAAAGLFIS